MKKKIKLSEWAKINCMEYRSAWRLAKSGKLDDIVEILPSGKILVLVDENEKNEKDVYLYARVSSHDQKEDLERQLLRLFTYASQNGYNVIGFEKEIASGLNDKRKKLEKVLKCNKSSKIIVEHKDRLTRFGFNYLELLLKKDNREIIVIHDNEDKKEDLIEDFVSIITSFCAKIYGSRKSKRKVLDIKEQLKDD